MNRTLDFFKAKATQAIENVESDQRLLLSAHANGQGLFLEFKSGSTVATYTPPLDDFYAGLRRAATVRGMLDHDLCEEQIRQFESQGGVPWAVYANVDGEHCWHFGRFIPPERTN